MDAEEVTFKFSWGDMAGKWWGPRDVRPILLIHGWQDSCGSFDCLVPLLPRDLSYLAIDLPGHGRSSWIPNGLNYYCFDFAFVILELCERLNWTKVSLIGHSMGAVIAFYFASLFQAKLDFVIAVDTLKARIPLPKYAAERIQTIGEHLQVANRRNRNGSTPPLYTYKELRDRFADGWAGEVDADKLDHIIARSARQSTDDPSTYYIARDSRVKSILDIYLSHETGLDLLRRIRVPYLFFRGNDGSFTELRKYLDQTIEVFRQSNPLFKTIRVNGSHYFHLNHPESIASDVTEFIRRYRSICDDKAAPVTSKL